MWCKIMRVNIKNRRRASAQVESLEGKTLLSAGFVSHHAAHRAMTAAVVAQAAQFSGTLMGVYSNVHIPFAGYLLNYSTSGTLSGVGSTNLHGSIFVRPGAHFGQAAGQFFMHNDGGSMLVRFNRTATPGTYTYKVVRGLGNDLAYKGGTGTVTITQTPTQSYPYFVSGQATMTFTPS
jgi:hypothetical protein